MKSINQQTIIVHSPSTKPNILIEESIWAPNDVVYFIPQDGFNFEKVYRFQATFYPSWVTKFLSLFNIKGKIIQYKGYKL